MAQSFRDLRIWQEAHKLLLEIYYITKKLPKEKLYILTSQLKRSALSIMANIAESQGRYGYQDKIQLLIYCSWFHRGKTKPFISSLWLKLY